MLSVTLSVIMLSVAMLSVVIMNNVMPSVIMLSVVGPGLVLSKEKKKELDMKRFPVHQIIISPLINAYGWVC